MSEEDFSKAVLDTAEKLIDKACNGDDVKAGLLLRAAKPMVNLGMEALRTQLREDPEEVYKWLVLAREELEKTLKIYENKPKP